MKENIGAVLRYYPLKRSEIFGNDEVVEENTVIRIPFVFRPKGFDLKSDNTKTATIFINGNFGS